MNDVIIKKFWANVEKTDTCWNWIGSTNGTGLLTMSLGTHDAGTYIRYNPRRLSLDIVGKLSSIPSHIKPLICRNKLCVNPHHLVQGDEARFWSYVHKLEENDCWIWIGGMSKGYGSITMKKDGKKTAIRSHVYSWELFTGKPVRKGLLVCHNCDHPYCVNPHHLFLGTYLDNNQDRNQKGRSCKGTEVNTCKITERQVKEIRKLHSEGRSTTQLAILFHIHRTNVLNIVKKKSWKHITDE